MRIPTSIIYTGKHCHQQNPFHISRSVSLSQTYIIHREHPLLTHMHTSWHAALSHLRVDAVDAAVTFHFTSLNSEFASQMSRSPVILPEPTLPSLF
jgi:hypothetical protein